MLRIRVKLFVIFKPYQINIVAKVEKERNINIKIIKSLGHPPLLFKAAVLS